MLRLEVEHKVISDPVIDAIRAWLATDWEVAHVCILSRTEVGTASITLNEVAYPSRGRFLLYSITKTIMAVAALRLVQEGSLDLDQNLASWLPEFSPAREFSLRQILQHTSGLPDYYGLKQYHDAVRQGGAPWTEDEFLARTEASRLRSPPGSAFAYSNIGYMLVRRVLVRATGEDFAVLLHRVVFVPLGIEDATVPTTKAELSGLTFGLSRYLGGDGEPVDVRQRYDPGWIATGVVGTSIVSAARFLHALFSGALLNQELLGEMSKGRAVPLEGDAGGLWQQSEYGLGLMMDVDNDGGRFFGHRGAGPGCSPAVFHFPNKKKPLTVCVITNSENPDQPVAMIKAVAATFPNS